MSIRNIIFSEGEYYHIYNRGNSKQIIFHDNKDHERFLALLFKANNNDDINISRCFSRGNGLVDVLKNKKEKPLVEMGIYCLMPNHFHLLICEKKKGNISIFMQKLLTAYSMYYNKKYKRTGTLFEGKFKAKHVDNDNYLKYLFSYIHLNPVKLIDSKWKENGIKNVKRTKSFLDKYSYSSYLDFIGTKRIENKIINRENFPNYFENFKEFNRFVNEWLDYKES